MVKLEDQFCSRIRTGGAAAPLKGVGMTYLSVWVSSDRLEIPSAAQAYMFFQLLDRRVGMMSKEKVGTARLKARPFKANTASNRPEGTPNRVSLQKRPA